MARPRNIILTFLALVAFLLLAFGWELHAETEVKKSRAEFVAALERFEKKGQTPSEMERLPWAAQYMYLKSRVYPEREKELKKAGLALDRIRSYGKRIIRRHLRSRVDEYVAVAGELLKKTEETWANEKAIDAAYFSRNWDKRQELALQRSGLVEKQRELMESERQKWKETGL